MSGYPDEPRAVPGSTTLTAEMADQLEQRFGHRYLAIQNGDPRVANRKQRRRAKNRRQDLG